MKFQKNSASTLVIIVSNGRKLNRIRWQLNPIDSRISHLLVLRIKLHPAVSFLVLRSEQKRGWARTNELITTHRYECDTAYGRKGIANYRCEETEIKVTHHGGLRLFQVSDRSVLLPRLQICSTSYHELPQNRRAQANTGDTSTSAAAWPLSSNLGFVSADSGREARGLGVGGAARWWQANASVLGGQRVAWSGNSVGAHQRQRLRSDNAEIHESQFYILSNQKNQSSCSQRN